MALFIYFVKAGENNIEMADAFQAALTAQNITPNKTVDNFYCYQTPCANYLRTIGIQGAPSLVAIDTEDDTKIGETIDPENVAQFMTDAQATYDAKYPA